MLILDSTKLNYDNLLIVPQRSELDSRSSVNLLREYKFPWCKSSLTCTGVIASNMYNTGTLKMAYALGEHNLLTALHKHHTEEQLLNILGDPVVDQKFFITIGESNEELNTLAKLYMRACHEYRFQQNRLMVCIDVANAYRQSFVGFIERFRDIFPDCLLMAGNVTTPDMTRELIQAGVDIVKIGIGPGSACETRRVTGVGYPMASACIECADAAHGAKGRICADGGCRTVGDICKAFCLEADFVMVGGMLAGTDECDGEWSHDETKVWKYYEDIKDYRYCPFVEGGMVGFDVDNGKNTYCTFDKDKDGLIEYGNKRALKFFGMSSSEAMEKFGGADKKYRTSEGKSVYVDYKGPAARVAEEILGGLRSCCTYIGASSLKEMPRRATLVKVQG